MKGVVPTILLAWLGTTFVVTAQESVRTLAGRAAETGAQNGPGAISRFNDPAGLAVDAAGILYVADSANHCVRRIGLDGLVTTVIGRAGEAGAADGTTVTARLDSPSAVAVGADGTLFIADTGNHTLRRFRQGLLTTLAGVAGDPGPTNGVPGTARFNTPLGLAVTTAGDVWVADSGNHSIRRVSPAGVVETLAGASGEWGAVDGTGSSARFNGPVGVALAADGVLVVADSLNHAVRAVTPAGVVTTIAGQLGSDGWQDGPVTVARFCQPAELQFDAFGNLFVVDAFYHRLRRLDTKGLVTSVAGGVGEEGSADGANGRARFFNPYGVAVRPNGAVVVSDTYNATVREVIPPFQQGLVRHPEGPVLHWESVVGLTYQVMQSTELGGPWQPLTAPRVATGRISQWPMAGFGTPAGSTWLRVQRAE